MARYPLDWGNDPDTADDPAEPGSSPATEPYPLEWGTYTDPPANGDDAPGRPPASQRYPLEWGTHTDLPAAAKDVSAAPCEFTALMPSLLGGAHPDTFPARVTLADYEPDNDGADNTQLAQAPKPSVQGRPPKPVPPAPQATPPSSEEIDRRATAAKQELNRLASEPLAPPKPTEKQPIPADWERQLPKATLDALNANAARFHVPRELLARILWQESGFDEKGGVVANLPGQGIAALTEPTIAELKRLALVRGDAARLRELQTFDRLKATDSISMAAEYLRRCYDLSGKSPTNDRGKTWAAALAGYNVGPSAVYKWQNGMDDSIIRKEAWRKAKPYLQYVFQGDPGCFDRGSALDVP